VVLWLCLFLKSASQFYILIGWCLLCDRRRRVQRWSTTYVRRANITFGCLQSTRPDVSVFQLSVDRLFCLEVIKGRFFQSNKIVTVLIFLYNVKRDRRRRMYKQRIIDVSFSWRLCTSAFNFYSFVNLFNQIFEMKTFVTEKKNIYLLIDLGPSGHLAFLAIMLIVWLHTLSMLYKFYSLFWFLFSMALTF